LYASTFTIIDVNVRALIADRRLETSARKAMENANNTAAKEAEKALAVAEAERLKIAAEGEATANRILSSSLTPQLLELKRLEAQKAFAGQGTHTVLMPANTSANVFVGK
jgi:regulator of protease activity HflC (stomatin/prohibitin superfamily)